MADGAGMAGVPLDVSGRKPGAGWAAYMPWIRMPP